MRFRQVTAVAAALIVTGAAWSDEIVYKVYSDGWSVPMSPEMVGKAEPIAVSKSFTVNGLTFNVSYEDQVQGNGQGFDDPAEGAQRRARAEAALATVATTLNETGELDVKVGVSGNLGGPLAQGGTYFSSAVQFGNGAAFLRIQSGSKPFGGLEEVFVQLDFGNAFYAGADPGGIQFGQIDLETVLLHEFTHALGFLSLSDDQGLSAFQDEEGESVPGVYSVLDSLMLRGSGPESFNLFVGPSPTLGGTFQGTPPDLVSNDVFFGGIASSAEFGDNPPLYAPVFFALGTSLSHWDTGNVPQAVMEHVVFQGEISRGYPPFERAALFDLGWNKVVVTGGPDPLDPSPPFPQAPPGSPVGGPVAWLLLIAAMLALGVAMRVRAVRP